MILYRVNIAAHEGEGDEADHSEWFASLEAAMRRRAELIRENPTDEGWLFSSDFAIDRYELAKLPLKQLALAILNDKGYVVRYEEVVPPYTPKPHTVEL